MNVKNNRRRKASQEKIEKAFMELLQTREIKEITVSDLIKITGLNRSTFYANYTDVYDLADQTRTALENEFSDLFAGYDYYTDHSGAAKMFSHIRDNQLFYKTYFKLCYDEKHLISNYDMKRAEKEQLNHHLKYHIEFFRNGLNAIIKMWLADGCQETPEEMAEVLKQEYRGRSLEIGTDAEQ